MTGLIKGGRARLSICGVSVCIGRFMSGLYRVMEEGVGCEVRFGAAT